MYRMKLLELLMYIREQVVSDPVHIPTDLQSLIEEPPKMYPSLQEKVATELAVTGSL